MIILIEDLNFTNTDKRFSVRNGGTFEFLNVYYLKAPEQLKACGVDQYMIYADSKVRPIVDFSS